MPCKQKKAKTKNKKQNDNIAKEEEERLFFLGKDSANEKPRILFNMALPTSLGLP